MLAAAALALSLVATQADDAWQDEQDEHHPHVILTAWGGDVLGTSGSGRSSTLLGGEVAWAFDTLDVGVAGYGYERLADSNRQWTQIALLRLTQRFPVGRGVEAAFGFGVGAGKPAGWEVWYQVALGVRVPLGPLFLAGELGFEQLDLLRLAAGLGVRF